MKHDPLSWMLHEYSRAELRITRLLQQWQAGEDQALDLVINQLYADLKSTARRFLRGESPDNTFTPTAMVNEFFLRLKQGKQMPFRGRVHFLWFAAELMRRILVEHARAKGAQKRGGGSNPATFDEADGGFRFLSTKSSTLLALDEGLDRLAELDPRQAQIVTMRFFGGLEVQEVAAVLEISPTTVKREWRIAKHWLARAIQSDHIKV